MDISILIPCYNEEPTLDRITADLRPVLQQLAPGKLEIVFVDDGSADDTWARLNAIAAQGLPEAEVRLVRHERNRGLGAAIRTGFQACRGRVVVTTDCDGTFRFSEIPALLSLLGPDVDVVTASPYHPAGGVAGVPPHRLALSRGASVLYRSLVDRRIHTYTSLFRAYRADVIRSVEFESDGFLAVTELLVNAHRAGYRIVEYPTVLHTRATGSSKMRLAQTVLSHVRFQSRILLRRTGPVPVRRYPAAPDASFKATHRQ